MDQQVYLVFGDLHGRILPAFRLATAWARDHRVAVAGLLQVGDLGYFPGLGRLDKATQRHAQSDPLELGTLEVVVCNELADRVFAEAECPPALWFTAGNHEDFDALDELGKPTAKSDFADYAVDAYDRVWCVHDGKVLAVSGGPRVAALWGIDRAGANARKNYPDRAYIRPRSATALAARPFDVLLCHDGPRDGVRPGYGSEDVTALIQLAQPRFAFFGHYKGRGRKVEGDFGRTQVYHLCGMELSHRDGRAEPGSVGALLWNGSGEQFDYLEDDWLRTFTRHNWKHR
jgi:hypothetical protein